MAEKMENNNPDQTDFEHLIEITGGKMETASELMSLYHVCFLKMRGFSLEEALEQCGRANDPAFAMSVRTHWDELVDLDSTAKLFSEGKI